MPETDRLITTSQAATLLGVSRRTIHRMVHAQTLTPVVTFPGGNGIYMFDPTDIDVLLRAQPA